MKVIAVNIAKPTVVRWKGKEVLTGIYKYPVSSSIFLEKEDVRGDAVIDRKYHGGADKACYAFSADHYPYWKQHYPDLEWNWGMFGENITIEGLDESRLHIGDVLKIGNATVQVTQPRQPCFKLGIKFGDQKVLKEFITYEHPGAYLRVLTPGAVKAGDPVEIIEQDTQRFSLQEVFSLLYKPVPGHIPQIIAHPLLAESCKKDLDRIFSRIS
ncbi:MOSC domain-containing protein [Sinomicrobium pectinilyticum]|uniref:MOSC domain-containing protein n=1 Tax=Sinomicrobium pectinilyticum TaxID=1084421 RepID=A0A3N0ESZ0_SINP1|nr:MOSC domain-containing protein [Sinomicrobium pectinilyticum]RNL91030.1 MOSC domain-containing protein [Sinomicrobium pectinilyticum]